MGICGGGSCGLPSGGDDPHGARQLGDPIDTGSISIRGGDHQTANGRIFEKSGAALLRDESGLTGDLLAKLVVSLRRDAAALKRMSDAARTLASPHAAQKLADLIEETVGAGMNGKYLPRHP